MKQRVLHVIDHTNSGGAQVVIRNMVRALKDQFSFAVAVLGNSGMYSYAYEELDVPVFRLGNQGSQWNPLSVMNLVDTIRRERFDLVHTHLFKANILGTIAAKWTASKTILHDHSGVYPQTLKYHISNGLIRHSYIYAYQHALSRCDRVLVLTSKDVSSYMEFYSVNPCRITVLPNAVDLSEFTSPAEYQDRRSLHHELGLSTQTSLVVMVGRLIPKKDWLTFLQVAQQVHQQSDQSCGFLIVGAGPEEQRLREFVGAYKLENVFFLGHRNDVPSLLQQADVFLLTSRQEPFGIVVLEAMAAGCPIVVTRSGGPESILTDGIDGLLADAGDIQGLTNHVLQLLRNKALRERLACGARQTVLNRYSVETVATRMAHIYAEVLNQ